MSNTGQYINKNGQIIECSQNYANRRHLRPAPIGGESFELKRYIRAGQVVECTEEFAELHGLEPAPELEDDDRNERFEVIAEMFTQGEVLPQGGDSLEDVLSDDEVISLIVGNYGMETATLPDIGETTSIDYTILDTSGDELCDNG